MKLRNKKTGEIGNLQPYGGDGMIWVWIGNRSIPEYRYNSLAELNEEWEDYEGPKYFWFIDDEGYTETESEEYEDNLEAMESIGNYFETEEEAKKAVEKLKVFKRLKDKGFRFDGWDENHHNLGIIEFSFDKVENNVWDFEKDLDLLFGGEE